MVSYDHFLVHLFPYLIDRLFRLDSSCNHEIAIQSTDCSQGIFDFCTAS